MESNAARLSRLLILLGAGIWLGAFLMLGFGVAPVNFATAEAWGLTGTNPGMPEQPVHYRTIGGELTGLAILRMNLIESVCLLLLVIGLLLAWNTRTGTDRNLIIRTVLVLFVAVAFYYYAVHLGGRLAEIRTTEPIDFSVTDSARQSAVHQEFNRLHQSYTRTASFAMACVAAVFGFTVFDRFPGNKAITPKENEG